MSFDLFQETAAKSLLFKQVYDSWQQFRESIYLWYSVSELGYSQFSLPNSVK
jgi:TRAP-type mannitol/chloroaromatic compound transport system substrate-binding protein